MGGCDKEVFNEVTLLGVGADDPTPPAALLPVGVQRHPFDVAAMTAGHDDLFLGNEVLVLHDVDRLDDATTTIVTVFVFDLMNVCTDDVQQDIGVTENQFVARDLLHHVRKLFGKFLNFKTGQAL